MKSFPFIYMQKILTALLCLLVSGVAEAQLTDGQHIFTKDGFMFWISYEHPEEVNIIGPLGEHGIHEYLGNMYDENQNLYHHRQITRMEVPATVTHPVTGKEYTVTEVDLTYCDTLEELILPATVKEADIYELYNLRHVELPEGLERLMIHHAYKLEELNLPTSLKELTPTYFSPAIGSLGIKTLRIPENFTKLTYTIGYCDELTEVELPWTEEIGGAMINLPKLKKAVFSPKLRHFCAINICPSIEEIWFPDDGNIYPWQIEVESFKLSNVKAIYCSRPNPPTSNYDLSNGQPPFLANESQVMFGGKENLKNVILYVRPECVEAYRAAPNLGLMDIRPYNFSDGLPLTATDSAPADNRLFDLSGREVTSPTPAPGIYISNGQKRVIR